MKNNVSITFLFVLFISLLQIIHSQDSVGMDCLAGTKGPGTCSQFYDCREPQPKKLPICGFDGLRPLICCPDTSLIVHNNLQYNTGHGGSTNFLGNRLGSTSPNRISEEKCREYSRDVTRNVTAVVLTADASFVTHSVAKCDYTNVHLIVGGEEVKVGEFPHMVALGYGDAPNYEFNCGGTLISENYVLSAAHCTRTSEYGDPKIARLGEHDLQSTQDGANPVDVAVTQVTLHPEYRPPRKYHDIALLKLARRVQLNPSIRPACLPQDSPGDGAKAVATGWGRIQYSEEASPKLLKVVIPLVQKDTCTRLWASSVKVSASQLPRGIDHDTMICAGAEEGGKDTCLGDSGGPLTITNSKNECVHYVIGVTSFGKYCGFRNSPGIYTRVSHYVPWIESIVWPGQ